MDPELNRPFISAAQSIAHELMRNAVWYKDSCTWVDTGADYTRERPIVQAKSMGSIVYNGLSGVLVFLTRLYKVQPDELYLDYIDGVINAIISNYEQVDNHWSYFMGRLGVLHSLWTAYRIINDKKGLDDVLSKLNSLLQNTNSSFESELLYGISGSITPLLDLLAYFELNKSPIINRIGKEILKSAENSEGISTWPTSITSHALTGLSHGASGISLALLKLLESTGEEIYKETLLTALSFENRYFDAHVCNWKDLRNTGLSPEEGTEEYSMAWCNGAPGIGVARLEGWLVTRDNQIKKEAELAFDKTRDYIHQVLSSPHNYVDFSLCHGLAGNAMILHHAGKVLSRQDYTNIAHQVAMFGLHYYHQPALSWPSGSRHPDDGSPLPSFNLMLGTSGIGLFYLSLVDGDFKLPNF